MESELEPAPAPAPTLAASRGAGLQRCASIVRQLMVLEAVSSWECNVQAAIPHDQQLATLPEAAPVELPDSALVTALVNKARQLEQCWQEAELEATQAKRVAEGHALRVMDYISEIGAMGHKLTQMERHVVELQRELNGLAEEQGVLNASSVVKGCELHSLRQTIVAEREERHKAEEEFADRWTAASGGLCSECSQAVAAVHTSVRGQFSLLGLVRREQSALCVMNAELEAAHDALNIALAEVRCLFAWCLSVRGGLAGVCIEGAGGATVV